MKNDWTEKRDHENKNEYVWYLYRVSCNLKYDKIF